MATIADLQRIESELKRRQSELDALKQYQNSDGTWRDEQALYHLTGKTKELNRWRAEVYNRVKTERRTQSSTLNAWERRFRLLGDISSLRGKPGREGQIAELQKKLREVETELRNPDEPTDTEWRDYFLQPDAPLVRLPTLVDSAELGRALFAQQAIIGRRRLEAKVKSSRRWADYQWELAEAEGRRKAELQAWYSKWSTEQVIAAEQAKGLQFAASAIEVTNVAIGVAFQVVASIAFGPVLGPILSAAMAMATELTKGARLDRALLANIGSAIPIPGGPIAAAAAKVGLGIAQGKDPVEVGLNALPLSNEQKNILKASVNLIRDLAEGKNITQASLDVVMASLPMASRWAVREAAKTSLVKAADKLVSEATSKLPREAQDAFALGVALAKAAREQEAYIRKNVIAAIEQAGPSLPTDLLDYGRGDIYFDKAKQEMLKKIPPEYRKGYETAVGAYNYYSRGEHVKDLDKFLLETRDRVSGWGAYALNEGERKAYDIALAQLRGEVAPKFLSVKNIAKQKPKLTIGNLAKLISLAKLPQPSNPRERAAFQLTTGLAGAFTPERRAELAVVVTKDPAMRKGATLAIKEATKIKSIWRRIAEFLGFVAISPIPP